MAIDPAQLQEDAELAKPATADKDLSALSSMIQRAQDLKLRIEEVEKELALKKSQLFFMTTREIPDAMREIGVEQFLTSTGLNVSLKKFYGASISSEHEIEAFRWLRQQGHGSLIKVQLDARFDKGKEGAAREAVKLVEGLASSLVVKESVHPTTLKAFVKEQLEAGTQVPVSLFGVFVETRANIKQTEKES